jgi:threonine dehydratase
MISKTDISEAHERISHFIHRTPILTNSYLNKLSGADLYFKCENFQKIGAFKARGGMNAVLSLQKGDLIKGLTTHSSGNHAQAIAYAANIMDTKAYIVMPENAPKVKVNAVKEYGAEVIFCEATLEAREHTVQKVIENTGATFIHPFNNEHVIAGQATCAKELIEDAGLFDAILAPIGGGGLFAGTCLSAHYFSPSTLVYGAEPEGAADAVLSIKTGKIEQALYINTIADGLLTTLGEITFPIIKEHVREIFTVSELEIKQALRLVYERMKIVVEPSCVVPLAAVLKNKELFKGKKVGIILTGGNIDLMKIAEYLVDPQKVKNQV